MSRQFNDSSKKRLDVKLGLTDLLTGAFGNSPF